MQVSMKKLRSSTKEIINALDRGDKVLITYRGKVRAKIISMQEEESIDREDHLFGIWKDYEDIGSAEDYIEKVRKGRYP